MGVVTGFSQTTKTTKADGLWSDPNTWTGGIIPDASNKATINNDVIIDMDVVILSLTINAASSLTFDTTAALVFTVNDELIVNGLFTVSKNEVTPFKHIVEVGADFYGPGAVDFYNPNGDMVELVFIGNSNSTIKDIQDVTGIGGQGKFGGLRVEKSMTSAVVTLQKSITINSGSSAALQGNVIIKKGVLDTDSCFIQAGNNTNLLEIDSLAKLYIASDDIHSCNGFEQYIIHPNSTVKYYRDGDYEMTKDWKTFDGNLGNLIVSGSGTKFFGDSVVNRDIYGDFIIETGGNYSVDNDTVVVHKPLLVNGTLSTDNKNSLITFGSVVTITGTGAWHATINDWFVFKNGLTVSNDAEFNGGSGLYTFTANDQEIYLEDTIQNIIVDGITLLNSDSLTCDVIRGSGTLVNQYYLDITGQAIQCNLSLDSINNKVVYSNPDPIISSFAYEILEITGTGTASMSGNVVIRNSLIKEVEGYISLDDFNLTLDTAALMKFDNPSYSKMIVTGGAGSLVLKSTIADRFMTLYPVGTITDTAAYTPFEITNMVKHPVGERYIAINAVSGTHPGMESTSGLQKYWSIDTDILAADSVEADLKFRYIGTEAGDMESIYKVRYWIGDEPWLEPDNWDIDYANNVITATGINQFAADWTAGDSTSIVSKINKLVFTPAPGILNNPQLVTITSSTPDIAIYYLFSHGFPGIFDSLYTDPIAVDSAMVINAIAFKEGWQDSDTTTAVYTFMVDTVEFSKPAGPYTGAQSIELNCSTIDAEIKYTTDGTEPSENSTLYSAPIVVESSTTIKAIAFKDKYLPSAISEALYSITITAVRDQEAENTFKIYPVPAHDYITIDLSNSITKEYNLSIMNLAGINVYKMVVNSSEIVEVDIKNLAPGTYFILLNTGKEFKIEKFIKL
jgi:hypothetical protein